MKQTIDCVNTVQSSSFPSLVSETLEAQVEYIDETKEIIITNSFH